MKSLTRTIVSVLLLAVLLTSGLAAYAQDEELTTTVIADTTLRTKPADPAGQPIELVLVGETVTILGRTANGNWLFVETITGATGWVSTGDLEEVDIEGLEVFREVELAPPMEATLSINGDAVLLDAAHDTIGQVVDTLWEGRTGLMLGRTRGGNYVYVEMDNGAKGWVSVGAVNSDYPVTRPEVAQSGKVEIVEPAAPVATVLADALLRDTAHDVVGEDLETVLAGEEVPVMGITRGGNFIYVETITGAKGWLSVGSVELNVATSAIPAARSGQVEIVQPMPASVEIVEDATLADRPADRFVTVDDAPATVTGALLGKTANANYYYVELVSGAKGWLPAAAVATDFPPARVPVVRSGEVEIVEPPAKAFTVVAEAAELADRPADRFVPAGALWAGRAGRLLGRTANGNYVYVETDSGAKGWLPAGEVESEYAVAALPVARSGEVEIVESPAPVATVAADSLLRDTAHDVVGEDLETVPAGEEVPVMGITRGGSFVYVETITGAKGWLSLAGVELNVSPAAIPVMQSGSVEIAAPVAPDLEIAEDATLADRPADRFVTVDSAPATVAGTLLGKTANANYYYVELASGAKGWLPAAAVATDFPIARVPVVRSGEVEIVEPPAKAFTVTAETTELADRPADRYVTVDALEAGQAGTLVGRTANGNYVYVEMDSGATGWLSAGEVESEYAVAALPVARSGEVEIVPVGTVAELAGVNVRQAPSMDADVIVALIQNTTVQITGISEDGEWFAVVTPDGEAGWMFADLINTGYDVTQLPVQSAE